MINKEINKIANNIYWFILLKGKVCRKEIKKYILLLYSNYINVKFDIWNFDYAMALLISNKYIEENNFNNYVANKITRSINLYAYS